jgi:uncharacterized protein (TIGR04141 family)
LDLEESSFVLSAGKWYKLEKDFVKQVKRSFATIPSYSGSLLEYDDETEADYNARVAESNIKKYCLMDCNLVHRGGSVEFCDLFTRDKEIIHVKRYGGSSVLSHLFYQGVVSGELFQTDSEFRRLVLSKVSGHHRVFKADARPAYHEYHIVFAIISQSDKPLSVPFFSCVAARHAVRRLEGFGYRVSLAKIGVSENRKKLKRFRSSR